MGGPPVSVIVIAAGAVLVSAFCSPSPKALANVPWAKVTCDAVVAGESALKRIVTAVPLPLTGTVVLAALTVILAFPLSITPGDITFGNNGPFVMDCASSLAAS